MDITLIYFDFPFWRAEVSRIALFMGGIEFNDRRIDSEEFQRVKSNGCLDDGTLIPFGQLPVLVVNGVSVAQTGGIARFCGKLADLYPKDDDFLAAVIFLGTMIYRMCSFKEGLHGRLSGWACQYLDGAWCVSSS